MNEFRLDNLTELTRTSEADGVQLYRMSRWNPLSWIFLKRLKLILNLFPPGDSFGRLLEIGVGSGVLAPELSRRCQEYVGIDIHDQLPQVRRALAGTAPTLRLVGANVCSLPFADNSFQAVFALSVLEHVAAIEPAVSEIRRVLCKGGSLFVGFPVENAASNAILDVVKVVIGFDRKVHHPTNHRQILGELSRSMTRVTEQPYPWKSRIDVSLFYVAEWTK